MFWKKRKAIQIHKIGVDTINGNCFIFYSDYNKSAQLVSAVQQTNIPIKEGFEYIKAENERRSVVDWIRPEFGNTRTHDGSTDDHILYFNFTRKNA